MSGQVTFAVVVEETGERHGLSGSHVSLGRSPGQPGLPGLWFDEPTVSSLHALLAWNQEQERYQISHCSETNATLINGVGLERPVSLFSGDVIRLGNLSLRLESEGQSQERVLPRAKWDDYEEEGVLGEGAMAVVLLGRERAGGRQVAIKCLRGTHPSLRRALENEGELLARLDRPDLVKALAWVEDEERIGLVLEYFPGVTLSRWIDTSSRSERLARAPQLLGRIGRALEYLHSLQVIVRDLKPDNVLVNEDGEICLIDFGIARPVAENLVTEGLLKGFASVNYAPLEQYSAEQSTDQSSDVYALGATAFHLLAGEAPLSAIESLSTGRRPEQRLRELEVEEDWVELIGSAMRRRWERCSLGEFQGGLARLPRRLQAAPRDRSSWWFGCCVLVYLLWLTWALTG